MVLNVFFCGGALSCVSFFLGRRFPSSDYTTLPKKQGGKKLEADPEAIWKHVLEQVCGMRCAYYPDLGKAGRSLDSMVPLKGGIRWFPEGRFNTQGIFFPRVLC